MTTTALPNAVVEKDHKLRKAGEELIKLRWHWTKNKDNANRVTAAAYAKSVGVGTSVVTQGAQAYIDMMKARESGEIGKKPGSPKTASDFTRIAQRKAETVAAIEAVAAATGNSVSHTERRYRDEVNAVLAKANAKVTREAKANKITTVEAEVPKIAQDQAKKAAASKAKTQAKKAKHTMTALKAEAKIAAATKQLGVFLDIAEGVEFDKNELVLLDKALASLEAAVALVRQRLAGEANIDWDAEFQKIDIS